MKEFTVLNAEVKVGDDELGCRLRADFDTSKDIRAADPWLWVTGQMAKSLIKERRAHRERQAHQDT